MLKSHLIAVMTGWYESVIKREEEQILSILKRDYEAKNEMNKKMKPEEFVEWATGGGTICQSQVFITYFLFRK